MRSQNELRRLLMRAMAQRMLDVIAALSHLQARRLRAFVAGRRALTGDEIVALWLFFEGVEQAETDMAHANGEGRPWPH